MKLIRTEDAAGQVLCHDITQIIPGEFKGARFRKGHIIQPEDIPVLLSIGKENLYVWEKKPGILHEDEAAALLYKAAAGRNIHGTEPKEGKIELIADCDGLLKINREDPAGREPHAPRLMIATIHGDLPVKRARNWPVPASSRWSSSRRRSRDKATLLSSPPRRIRIVKDTKYIWDEPPYWVTPPNSP